MRDKIGPDTTAEQFAKLALAATTELPTQRHVYRVRETPATYLPSWAVA